MKLSNGIEIEDVTGQMLEEQKKNFHGYMTGLVRTVDTGFLMPSAFKKYAESYLNFQFRKSDVVVATYPKCGTTWMQEILWTMCHNPNLDHPLTESNLSFRAPFLEFDTLISDLTEVNGPNPAAMEALQKMAPNVDGSEDVFMKLCEYVPDRRIIKTHLSFKLLPDNLLDTAKVVYVARNPKDAVVSYLHHSRLIKVHDFRGTDDDFADFFIKGEVLYGAYDRHVEEAWQLRNNQNLLIVLFEDLKKDTLQELKKIDSFLGTNLTDRQIQNVANHTTFNKMKTREPKRLTEVSSEAKTEVKEGQGVKGLFNENKEKNSSFFRKGVVGSWKSDMSPESIAKMEKFIEEKVSPKIGFEFSYGS